MRWHIETVWGTFLTAPTDGVPGGREIPVRDRVRWRLLGLAALIAATVLATEVQASPTPPAPLQWPSHGPIRILGDGDFTPANGVIGGQGTPADPYEIAMWDIDASGATGIVIRDTRASFFLHDVFVHDGGTAFDGLVFGNVSDGRIEMVSTMRNRIGMDLASVSNLTLNGDYADSNAGDGIDIMDGTNLTITGNSGGHEAIGLRINGGRMIDVNGNAFRGGNNLGLGLSGATDVHVDQNNFSSNSEAIIIQSVSNATFRGNLVFETAFSSFVATGFTDVEVSNNTFGTGFELAVATSVSIADNRLLAGSLHLASSANVRVERNTLSGGTDADLHAEASSDVTLIANRAPGIRLTDVTNATLRGNVLSGDGLAIAGTTRAHYASHTISADNLDGGLPIRYYRDAQGLVVDGVSAAQLFIANCTDVRVAHVDVGRAHSGILAAYVDGLAVEDSNASAPSGDGIFLDTVANVTFDRVNVTQSTWGIRGVHLAGVAIRNSTAIGSWSSIYLALASAVSLLDSNLVGTGFGWGFYLQSVTGIRVEGNRIANHDEDVRLDLSANGLVRGNNLTGARAGIGAGLRITDASNVTVVRNDLTDDLVGVDLESARSIVVHHNRFFGDRLSAFDTGEPSNRWDDGYPSGGNVWSDYRGWDDCGGPNQDVCPGSDGLGDIPYEIGPLPKLDRYPIVEVNPVNNPPVARFTYAPDPPILDVGIRFDASASVDPDGWPLRYDWTFGDGFTASDVGPVLYHAFATYGTMTADLTVTDVRGATATTEMVFRVVAPAVAFFTVAPAQPIVGQTVTFDASMSYEPGGMIVAWAWDFGDYTTGSGVIVSHTYSSTQAFVVTLTILDDSGISWTYQQIVSVEVAPPPPLVLVEYTSPAGFRLPIPVNWTKQENQVIGGETIELVLLGPTRGSIRTNILVDTGSDSTVHETPAYLLSLANETVRSLQRGTTQQIDVTDGPTVRTIAGHAGVSFTIVYGTSGLTQKVAIVVSESHQRYWLLVLTTDASSYATMNEGFERMLAGFEITIGPPLSPLLIAAGAGAVIGAVGFVIALLVVRARRKAAPPAGMTAAPWPAQFPVICGRCGLPNPPGDAFCSHCGNPLR